MSREIIIDQLGTIKKVESPFTPNIPEENIIETPHKRINVGWRRVFEGIEGISKVIKEADICQDEGDYKVKINRPDIPWTIGLVFSDAHIGTYQTDHKLIKDLIDKVIQTPNSYLIDDGDTFNNGIWGGLQYEDVIPPYLQAFTVKDMARELGNKFAACVIGNHPEWMFANAGIEPEYMFAENLEAPIFPGMGLLHLKAGNQEYKVAMAHDYWGKSKINIHNCCVRLRENEYPEADVFIVGHQHIWGYMKEMVDGREVLYIRPGTARTTDRYARIHGIAKRGQQMGIALMCRTDKKYFTAMPIDEGIEMMK